MRLYDLARLQFDTVLTTIGVALAAISACATAEPVAGAAGRVDGIEHVLYLTVNADPFSPLLTQSNGEPHQSNLIVSFRISAHSQETNFFGIVHTTVPNFDLAKGSSGQEIWRDGKCHHERGFPKITVTAIDGLVLSGQQKLPVVSRYRQLGLFVPKDEVMPSKRMGSGTDNIGPYLATRTETKQSRLFLNLKLYILSCSLSGVSQTLPR